MGAFRYLVAVLAFGVVADWGSEIAFWSAAPPGFSIPDHLITIVAYACAAGLAISAMSFCGLGGIRGAFLGGVLLGYVVEGVVVTTIYDNLPWQLVWTPVAWHGVVTGVLVVGMGRAVGRLGPWRMACYWAALGLGLGFWAQGWVLERTDLPGIGPLLAYLGGLALVVPVANIVLDRLGSLPRPGRWVGLFLPVLAVVIWALSLTTTPSPVRLLWPVLTGLTVWIAWRLGKRDAAPATDAASATGRGPVSLGARPARAWHHALMLIAPAVAAPVAVAGWTGGGWLALDDLSSMKAIAVLSSIVGAGWYLLLLVQALRPQRPRHGTRDVRT